MSEIENGHEGDRFYDLDARLNFEEKRLFKLLTELNFDGVLPPTVINAYHDDDSFEDNKSGNLDGKNYEVLLSAKDLEIESLKSKLLEQENIIKNILLRKREVCK